MRHLMPSVEHINDKGANNRAENSQFKGLLGFPLAEQAGLGGAAHVPRLRLRLLPGYAT